MRDMLLLLYGLTTTALVSAKSSLSTFHEPQTSREGTNCGQSLFLSQYLEKNRISEAREAAKVATFLPKEPQIVSYSGYITVNKDYDSNLFFWLFPSMKEPKRAPVVLWLADSPGAASSSSPFFKNGPYVVAKCQCDCHPLVLSPASYHWSEIMHVVYIDSPAGAGFSFTKNPSGFANSTEDVVKDLYSALLQILQLFPEYQLNDFFIAGEYYSASLVPALAYLIYHKNPKASLKINLKGIAIGDGWLDPLNMFDYSDVLYSIGLIDSLTREKFSAVENIIESLIRNGTYSEAFDILEQYLPVSPAQTNSTMVGNVTGFTYFGNYLRKDNNEENTIKVAQFLNQAENRKKLHVGGQHFTMMNQNVFDRLKIDLLKSVAPKLEVVMDNFQVVMYSGQLDVSCANYLTANVIRKLKWQGAEKYKKAQRTKWFVEREFAGYVKTVGNFREILVRNAGINVIRDQPLWAWDLMKRFTQSLPFSEQDTF